MLPSYRSNHKAETFLALRPSLSWLAGLWAVLFFCAPLATAQSQLKKQNLKKTDRAEWRKLLHWPDDCEEAFQQTFKDEEQAGMEFYPLGNSQYLINITCYPGAYQPGFVLALYDEVKKKSRLLRLKRYERATNGRVAAHEGAEINGFDKFDPKTKELTIFSKSRGLGDCGSLTIYRVASGSLFIKEARAQACYDERPAVTDPKHWPLIKKP